MLVMETIAKIRRAYFQEVDTADLPGPLRVAQDGPEGHSLWRHGVHLRA